MTADSGGARVLLVDDEPENIEEIAEFLDMQGLSCRLATSADAAESALAETPSIGVVVSDIRMPGRSGIDLLVAVRDRLPVILVTGHNAAADAMTAHDEGAFRFFSKPVDPFALVEGIRAALTHREARDDS